VRLKQGKSKREKGKGRLRVMKELIPIENIQSKIYKIRGKHVMIDRDLAEIFGVETRRLNEQAKRNIERFPEEFMFQLTTKEYTDLISQNEISSWGGVRKLPYVFTEHGTIMLSSVLKTKKAIEMSILVVKAFVKLRDMYAFYDELRIKIREIEMRQSDSEEHIQSIIEAVNMLLVPPEENKRQIGFITGNRD
jgi:hypothetical protein